VLRRASAVCYACGVGCLPSFPLPAHSLSLLSTARPGTWRREAFLKGFSAGRRTVYRPVWCHGGLHSPCDCRSRSRTKLTIAGVGKSSFVCRLESGLLCVVAFKEGAFSNKGLGKLLSKHGWRLLNNFDSVLSLAFGSLLRRG